MKTSILALTAALALTAGASLAQPPAQPGPQDGRYAHARPDPAQFAERRAQMAERHAQRLRDTLQLRPEQEPALQAFLSAGQRHGRMDGARRPGHAPGEARAALTTPQRLDRMRERMAARQAAFERRAEATKRFYAQLSPAQQRAFDAIGPKDGDHRHSGRHGHGGDHGPRGRG